MSNQHEESNWEMQMNGLGYDASGNPMPRRPAHEITIEVNANLNVTDKTALIMLRDINDQRRMGERIGKSMLGDDCDVKTREKFEAWLQGRISE